MRYHYTLTRMAKLLTEGLPIPSVLRMWRQKELSHADSSVNGCTPLQSFPAVPSKAEYVHTS